MKTLPKNLQLAAILGSIRRLGDTGPVYMVKDAILSERGCANAELQDGDFLLRILIPESNEELERKLSQCANDPEE